jgi:hypothetical protein
VLGLDEMEARLPHLGRLFLADLKRAVPREVRIDEIDGHARTLDTGDLPAFPAESPPCVPGCPWADKGLSPKPVAHGGVVVQIRVP